MSDNKSELDEMLSGLQDETNEQDKEFIISMLKKYNLDDIFLQVLGYNGDDLFYRVLSQLYDDEIRKTMRLNAIKKAREELETEIIQRGMIRKGDKIVRQGQEFSLSEIVEYFQVGEKHNPSPIPVIEKINFLKFFYNVEPKLSYNWKHLSSIAKQIAKQDRIKWCKLCWEQENECDCKEPEIIDFPPFLRKVEKKTIKIKEKKT